MIRHIKKRLNKVLSRVIEADAINVSASILHQKTFSQFKNMCYGKEVVVCGAGPTLQKYQPIAGTINIAVNRAFMYDKVDFDFIFSQDYQGLYMVQNELIDYRPGKCVKLLGTQYGMPEKEIPESLIIKAGALKFYTDSHIYGDGYDSKFVVDIDRMPLGNLPNVGLSVMQFALFLNPSRIYIVGCDMSGNHFLNPNLSEKEIIAMKNILDQKWTKEREQLVKKWIELRDFAKRHYPDTELVSVNPVTLKGVFRDLYQ